MLRIIMFLLILVPYRCYGLPVHLPALYIFGDSLSDIGRLQTLSFGKAPPKDSYWKGRFSSGPVWNEYTSQLLGYKLENRAVGKASSTSDNHSWFTSFMYPPSTQKQIQGLLKKPHTDDIAILEVGANDLQAALVDIESKRLSIDEFSEKVAAHVIHQLGMLVDMGFDEILLTNMPAFQNTPLARRLGRRELAAQTVNAYNSLLKEKVNEWQNNNKHHSLKLLDLIDFGAFVDTALKPQVTQMLEITNTETSCISGNNSWLDMFDDNFHWLSILKLLLGWNNMQACKNPNSLFFFDPIHPSGKVHRLFGYYVYDTISRIRNQQPLPKINEQMLVNMIKDRKLNDFIVLKGDISHL